MAWPYHFLDLTEAEKLARRQALDRYASYAQLSVLVPLGALFVYRIVQSGLSRQHSAGKSYDVIPNSPDLKAQRQASTNSWTALLRRARWWLGEEVVLSGTVLGHRDQWVGGSLWALWLLLLCVLETNQGEFDHHTLTYTTPHT